MAACRVLAEAPSGKGFGHAALTLTPLFQTRGFDPPMENMSFVITFEHQGEPFTIKPENCLPPSCIMEPSVAPAKP